MIGDRSAIRIVIAIYVLASVAAVILIGGME